MKNFLIFIFILLITPSLAQGKIAKAVTDHASVEILIESKEIYTNENLVLGIRFDLEPGWHVYWKNPGDSGLPPDINWVTEDGARLDKILWPAPEKTPENPLMTYGYYNELVLPLIFKIDKKFSEFKESSIEINFLICELICIPEQVIINFDAKDYTDEDIKRSRNILSSWYTKIPKDDKIEIYAEASDSFLSLSWVNEDNNTSGAYFYPDAGGLIRYAAKQLYVEENKTSKIIIERPPSYLPGILEASGVLEINSGRRKQSFNISPSIAYVSNIEPPKESSLSFWFAIVLAFFGGIILNVMPCVFPVIALKVMSFVKDSSSEGAWKHGVAFSIGVELSMLVLLGITFIFRNLGQAVGWGWQLQSSAVSSLLSVLFFAIAFTLLFKIEFGSSLTRLGNVGSKGAGYLNSVFLGGLTVIVATPCTGPFMGAAIGWGLSQPFYISVVIFFALGLGVAFPTLLLSTIPSGLSLLPKPGQWMVRAGQAMSIPMALTAIWLAWVVQRQAGFLGLRDLLIGLTFIIASLVIYKINIKNIIYRITSLVLIVIGSVYIVISSNSDRIIPTKDLFLAEKWTHEAVNQYKISKKNILINFTADWCLTCKVNEVVVFKSSSFNRLIENGELEYLVADWTNYDPKITKELERYERGGVPLYLYWKSGEIRPKILPAILTKKIFYDEIR